MNLNDYKLIFVVAGLIGVLLIASPVLSDIIRIPIDGPYSELYLLGPNHMAQNYPFNIEVGENYTVYLGVENSMGSSTYYMVYLKLRNATDSAPNPMTQTPSSLDPLYEYRFMLPNGQSWETPVTFSVNQASIAGGQSLISSLSIDGLSINVEKPSLQNTNSTATIFYYQFLFELWTYNSQSGAFSYFNRAVDLQMNLTVT